MSMDKVIKPKEHEFMSPLVNFSKFKETALRERNEWRETVDLKPLSEFKYPEDIPRKPSEPEQMLLNDTENDNELITEKLKEVYGLHDDDVQEVISSMDVSHLAALNRRDIMFRKNVDQDDVPEDTKLETLKLRRKVLEEFKPLKKPPPTNFLDERELLFGSVLGR